MISSSKEDKQNPPKFAIANGFVIGHIPRTNLTYHDSNGQPHSLEDVFDPDKHLNDLICAAISPELSSKNGSRTEFGSNNF
eukprot:scaffold38848_cov77-Cyclotella_meneghiniana.AAC.2